MKNNPRTDKKIEQESFEPFVIEASLKYKLTITENEYFLDYESTPANDLAGILIASKISEQLKKDIEVFKSMKSKISAADKKVMNNNYDNLIKSNYSLGKIADVIFMEALEKVSNNSSLK